MAQRLRIKSRLNKHRTCNLKRKKKNMFLCAEQCVNGNKFPSINDYFHKNIQIDRQRFFDKIPKMMNFPICVAKNEFGICFDIENARKSCSIRRDDIVCSNQFFRLATDIIECTKCRRFRWQSIILLFRRYLQKISFN